jgi:VWFA-related protein
MFIARKLVCGLALAAAALIAQAPVFNPPGTLVHINVTALDGNEPVGDLSAKDLNVTDQGKPETLLFFRRNSLAQPGGPLGPNEYSNRLGGLLPHSVVILFDILHHNPSDRLNIWHKLRASLPKLESGDGVYFYLLTLEGTLVPLRAIGPKSAADKTWPQDIGDAFDKAMKAASHARPAGMGDEDDVKKTYVALEALGNQLAALPGLRDIVWITNVVPNVSNTKGTCNGDWIDCALYVPHLSVTLDRDNVAVNPLSYSPSPDLSRDMDMMAGLTAGRSYFEGDIDAVVKQVSKGAANSYSIAYEPAPDTWDSKFHRVRVGAERKGLKLIGKQRYYALPDQRPPAARQQAALVAAYQDPNDLDNIGLRATITPAAGTPKAVHLQIQINLADLLLLEQVGHFTGGLTFLVSDVGASGPIGDPAQSSSMLNLTKEQRDAVLKTGLPLPMDHPFKDGTQKLRIIVLDQSTNAVGSLTLPVR